MAYYSKVGDYTPGTRARGLEIETEFDTIVTGFANVEAVVDADGALGKDLTGGAAYQLTGMVDAVNPQDYATLANVTAEVAGGGTPGNIPITSLGVGTASANEFIVINAGGTAPEGKTGTQAGALIPVTSLGIGSANAGESVVVNQAGTALETAGPLYGKNVVYNGGLAINQLIHVTTVTGATSYPQNSDDYFPYPDGYLLLSDGNDIVDVNYETTAANLPDGAVGAIKYDVETVSKKFGVLHIVEAREAARLWNGGNGKVSLSFKAKRTGSDMEIKAAILAWDSTADTVTSDVVSAWGVDGTTPTFATNWTAENTPADLGLSTSYQTFKIENISLDTASTTNLAVFVWCDTTTTNAGEFIYITDIQLEIGPKATEFEVVPQPIDLLRCQRYNFTISRDDVQNMYIANGFVRATTSFDAAIPLPTPMRGVPSVVSNAAATAFSAHVGNAGFTGSNLTARNPTGGNYVTGVLTMTSAGMTVGRGGMLFIDSTDAWLTFVTRY